MRIFYNTIGGRDRDSNPPIMNVSCANYSRIQDHSPRAKTSILVILSLSAYVMQISAPAVFPILIPFDLVLEDINSDAHLRCTTTAIPETHVTDTDQ
jgi:hypothetical protein